MLALSISFVGWGEIATSGSVLNSRFLDSTLVYPHAQSEPNSTSQNPTLVLKNRPSSHYGTILIFGFMSLEE